ncbi:hypothetical protein BGZ83_008261 [Gryganskiella cystojenkinii]|nr:hypothetical protein BGZ83_008261 [Gryganskiella cystojenkinii]
MAADHENPTLVMPPMGIQPAPQLAQSDSDLTILIEICFAGKVSKAKAMDELDMPAVLWFRDFLFEVFYIHASSAETTRSYEWEFL